MQDTIIAESEGERILKIDQLFAEVMGKNQSVFFSEHSVLYNRTIFSALKLLVGWQERHLACK